MAKAYVFYNPIAGGGQYEAALDTLKGFIEDETVLFDMTASEAYEKTISELSADDYIVVCGGDGTLNRFANRIAGLNIENDIRYFPCGTGNDFAREFGKSRYDEPFSVKDQLKGLPKVTINGETSYFINGVGFGIDGYCCEVGDKLRATSDKPVNYTAIAIKGLFFHYKPVNARVTIDGEVTEFKKVWIAPTMNGKFYGGGMMPAPAQDRSNADGKLSITLFHGSNPLKTFMIFPKIFKGEHIKSKKFVTVLTGNEITVEFDEPRAAQIDGETVLNVTSYTAKGYARAEAGVEAEAVAVSE